MRIGKAIDHSHDVGVVLPNMPTPRRTQLRYGLTAALLPSIVLGARADEPKGDNREKR
jgi:hypothetical protein